MQSGTPGGMDYPTYEEATKAAYQEAAATMSTMLPVLAYRQGNRTFLITSFPLGVLAHRVRFDPSHKGEDPDKHMNRPLMPEHWRSIETYLRTQEEYILPGVTLSIERPLRCHFVAGASPTRLGFAVLPESVVFAVTDGQHRIRALQEALRSRPSLKNDGIGVTIVQEGEIDKIHQDFVDCAQVKPIPAALLTAFNRRDPLARLAREVTEGFAVFRGRVEKAAKTVGKSSVNLFTMNQVRIGLAELIVGDSMQGGPQLKKAVDERLSDEHKIHEYLKVILRFYEWFATANPEWAKVANCPADSVSPTVDAARLREEYVHFTATGLVIMGRVGHHILELDLSEQDALVTKLGRLDWSRAADMWRGLVQDGKILTSRLPVQHAIASAVTAIGLEVKERHRTGSAEARGKPKAGRSESEPPAQPTLFQE